MNTGPSSRSRPMNSGTRCEDEGSARCINSSRSIKAVVEQGSSLSRIARIQPLVCLLANCKTNGHRHCQRPSPAVGVGTVPLPVNLHRQTALFAEMGSSCSRISRRNSIGAVSRHLQVHDSASTPLLFASRAAGLWPIWSAHNFHLRSTATPSSSAPSKLLLLGESPRWCRRFGIL